MLRSTILPGLLLVLCTSAVADDLILTDGRVLSGVTVKAEEAAYALTLPSGRLLLPKSSVFRLVTPKDEAGRKEVAFARRKEPSTFRGKHVVVTGRLARHVGTGAAELLSETARATALWFGPDPEKLVPIEVTVTAANYRRSLRRARAAVAREVLTRALPELSGAPFPIPALCVLGDAEADGGMLEAVGAGKVTDLTIEAVSAKDGRVEIGWSLLRYLNASPERWKDFLTVAKTSDAAAIRKWLDGIEGLEAAWRKHVEGWSLKGATQHVDAAYVALNARRMRRAAALFATAIEMGTKERDAFEGLAEIYVLAGDPARAMRVWQTALRADPLNVRARRSIGVYLSEKQSARVGGLYLRMADDVEKALGE